MYVIHVCVGNKEYVSVTLFYVNILFGQSPLYPKVQRGQQKPRNRIPANKDKTRFE